MNIFIFCWEKTIFVLTISSTLVLKMKNSMSGNLQVMTYIIPMEAFSTMAEVITNTAGKMDMRVG
jgi:hypothetical protein